MLPLGNDQPSDGLALGSGSSSHEYRRYRGKARGSSSKRADLSFIRPKYSWCLIGRRARVFLERSHGGAPESDPSCHDRELKLG